MSFQVLVKFSPAANTASSFLLGNKQAREKFVRQPGIWWYHFPEEDDDWRWHRGPAWQPAHTVTAGQVTESLASPAAPPEPPPNLVAYNEIAQGSDDEDSRW